MAKPKIYTKTGDSGQTSLVTGQKVSKTHPRLEAYGAIDELNSNIGAAISFLKKDSIFLKTPLLQIQNQLFIIGSHLACEDQKMAEKLPSLDTAAVKNLEAVIDKMEEDLNELTNFILPGGSHSASFLHISRTICRRAERNTLTLARESLPPSTLVLKYLNRLSDFLFVAARFANQNEGHSETTWSASSPVSQTED